MVTPQIARGRLLMLILSVAAVVMTTAAGVAALVRCVPQWFGS
ncbi:MULTISPECIES: hypothetical protein [Streptomyces]|nr:MULTISPECIES: hypothetical protein [Streptomyces]WSI27058.1 hypothetical protein OG311_28840 [Streptomyces sp. NBC_01343]